MWDALTQNLRSATRGIVTKTPGVSAAIVITLALGIGANAMMFGVIDRLLLSPPQHITDADRVRHLYIERTGSNGARDLTRLITYPDFEDLARLPAFANAAAYSAGAPEWTMGTGATARRVRVQQATASLFPTLGVHPLRGRFYTSAEDTAAPTATTASPTVVLSEEFWTRELGRDASVIGRVIQLNRGRYEVIGIAPAGFTGAELTPVDIWLPLRTSAYVESGNDAGFDDRGMSWLRIVVRLTPAATPEAAQAQLTTAHIAAVRAYELERGQAYLERRSHTPIDKQAPRVFTASVIAARGPSPSRMSSISLWLAGVSAIVLLIACANVANLLLARGIGMQRDMAIRAALGANRRRLVSQSLTEAAVLATAGAVAALGVAWWSSRVVHAVILPGVAFTDTGMPRRLLLFIALAAAITALFAGFLPALQASRAADTGAEALRASRGNSSSRSTVRGVLMVGQITLSVILLIGAGLFLRSLWGAMRTDVGFDREHTLTIFIEREADVSASRAERRQRQTEMYREALRRVEALPGVRSAALSAASTPFVGSDGFGTLELRIPGVEKIPELPGGSARKYWGSEDFFATLGLTVTRGRSFASEEFRDGAEPVAMVNETFARTIWPGQDTLAKCVVFNDPDRKRADGTIEPGPCRRIVGIFKDVTRVSLNEEKSLQIAFPAMRDAYVKGLIVRADANVDPASLSSSIRQAVSSVSSEVRFVAVRTYADRFETLLGPWRIGSTMFTAFGVLALTVAAVGLYSLLAFAVAQRRRELGIRAALGAKRRDLIGLVMHQAARFVGSGLLLGTLGALAASRYMDGVLFGMKTGSGGRDVTVYAAVMLTLIACGTLAALVPAWRATSVQPTTAMEAE